MRRLSCANNLFCRGNHSVFIAQTPHAGPDVASPGKYIQKTSVDPPDLLLYAVLGPEGFKICRGADEHDVCEDAGLFVSKAGDLF